MAGVEFLVFDDASGDLRPWISALEDQFATDDYSNLNKLALAVYLIGGKAEAFVHHRQESKYFYTWDDFKSSLLLKFGERDDPERIRLLAERDKSVLNGRNSETIKNTDAIQEVKEHIVNLEPNELHQEESALNATKTNVDQEMEVVCSIQDKILLEEINSVLETDGVHPREAIPKSQVLVSSTKSDYGEILFKSCSMNRITANQIDLVKNIECFDVAWLFSSRNLMDSVRVRDEFSKSLSDTESIGNAHQMYDRNSLRATSSEKHMKQLKCWKFKFKRKNLTGTRPKIEQHKLVISVTNLGQNEKRFSDLADRLQKANTVSDRCSGVQNIHGAVLWFNYKQKYSMRNLSLMMKCSKKKERFDVIQRLKQMREELMFVLQEAGRRYDIARSASVRYGGIQDVESTFSQLEGSYDEHMMLTENVGPDNSDEVVSCWISIPVTSLNQKEPERLIGLVDTVHRRAVSQDQVLYADLSSDNMTLVPDVNLQKHLMLQQVLVSDWRLGYSMSVFSSNQAVVQWFRIVQEFETDSGRNIRWLYIQFLACQNAFLNRNLLFQHKVSTSLTGLLPKDRILELCSMVNDAYDGVGIIWSNMSVSHTDVLSVLEMEHQVVYTNKLWDPGGTAVARCLRVLWRHQEQWCWSRLHINDSYAMRCSGRESDYAAGTSKATDSVEDTSGFPKRDSQSTHEAGSVTMSREDCSAESLILEELIKTEDSLQEDFSNEKTRERKFKDLCFSQGMIMASAIAMRDEMVFSGKSWETLKLMKQLGCRSDDMLQKFCTEMWLIVTARWTCDQRLMAFYEAVQNSWFAGVVGASNGTDSFSIWHRWRYRPAIALCAEQEVDKLNENLPSDFISSTGHSVFAGNIKTVSEDLVPFHLTLWSRFSGKGRFVTDK